MKTLKKNFERLEIAIKDLELSHKLVLEAKKNIKLKKTLEDKITKLKKDKASSLELIDQALEEIALLRKNVNKEEGSDG